MTGAAVFALLGAGALLLGGMSGGRRGSRSTTAECSPSPAAAAQLRARSALFDWVDCADRTARDVAELARLLDRAGRGPDADAVRARWNARRAVEDAEPDGRLGGAEEAAARRALDGEAPPTPPPTPRRRRSHVIEVTSDGGAPLTGRETEADLSVTRRSGGGYDPAQARRLAPMVARSIRSGSGYRGALRRFQAAAGLEPDGLYGPRSRAALRYYGVTDPPAARVSRDAPEEYAPPDAGVSESVSYEDGGAS